MHMYKVQFIHGRLIEDFIYFFIWSERVCLILRTTRTRTEEVLGFACYDLSQFFFTAVGDTLALHIDDFLIFLLSI